MMFWNERKAVKFPLAALTVLRRGKFTFWFWVHLSTIRNIRRLWQHNLKKKSKYVQLPTYSTHFDFFFNSSTTETVYYYDTHIFSWFKKKINHRFVIYLWFNSCNLQFNKYKKKCIKIKIPTYLHIYIFVHFRGGGICWHRSRKVGHMDNTGTIWNIPVLQMCISKQNGCITLYVPMG